jgi:hypothetical protein
VFGVLSDGLVARPGGVFLGLVKERDRDIRPSFLGQTHFVGFQLDLASQAKSLCLFNFILFYVSNLRCLFMLIFSHRQRGFGFLACRPLHYGLPRSRLRSVTCDPLGILSYTMPPRPVRSQLLVSVTCKCFVYVHPYNMLFVDFLESRAEGRQRFFKISPSPIALPKRERSTSPAVLCFPPCVSVLGCEDHRGAIRDDREDSRGLATVR